MIIGLIPARLNSKRLPLKPLRKLNGVSLIGHVLKRAMKSGVEVLCYNCIFNNDEIKLNEKIKFIKK